MNLESLPKIVKFEPGHSGIWTVAEIWTNRDSGDKFFWEQEETKQRKKCINTFELADVNG